jgi:hypothetical protein
MRATGLKNFLAAFAVALFGLNAHAVAVAPTASASIDWSTFSYQVFGLNGNPNPTFSFNEGSLSTNVNTTFPGPSDSSADWSTPLSVSSDVNFASANAGSLVAQFTTHPTVPSNSAQAQRYGSFTLGTDSYVVFSVMASASINMNTPAGGSAYAWAFLTADGPDMFGGPDTQTASTQKLVFSSGVGNPASQSGRLIASFSNLSGGDLVGTLSANAITSSYGGTIVLVPVPEPGMPALLLAGLALVGTVVARRRATPGRA